jgi:hypothetical protein
MTDLDAANYLKQIHVFESYIASNLAINYSSGRSGETVNLDSYTITTCLARLGSLR